MDNATPSSPDPRIVSAKSDILSGINAIVINALVNDLAVARVQIKSLESDVATLTEQAKSLMDLAKRGADVAQASVPPVSA